MIVSSVYMPTEEALKFIAFIRAAGLEENDSPPAHYQIADALFSADKKDWKLVIECLRGMGKSTLMEYVFLYVAALGYWPNFGKAPFWVFLGASQEGNVKGFFKNVASKVANSDFLASLITVKRQTDSEIELVNSNDVLTSSAGRGMATNWRGIRSAEGDRPTILLADDVLPNDVMTSEVIRKTIEVNWFNSALPAIDPMKHKVIYIGTPLSEADLLHKLKNSGAYRVIRFPLCEKFPVPEEEFKSIWPDRFTYEYTLDMFKQYEAAGTTQSFYTEYLLQITDLSTLLVEDDDIRWFDPSIFYKHKEGYNYYIVTDLATSSKKSADFSTIGVIAVSNIGDWFLVDGQCKRQTVQESLEDIFEYSKRWKPVSVGIETSGQQGGFISIIEDMMIQRSQWFTLARKQGSREIGIRPAKDKLERFIKGVQPRFKQGKIWLPRPEVCKNLNPRLWELVEELTHEIGRLTLAAGVKALKHDDAIDLLNQMSEMEIYLPSEAPMAEKQVIVGGDILQIPWTAMLEDGNEFDQGSTVF